MQLACCWTSVSTLAWSPTGLPCFQKWWGGFLLLLQNVWSPEHTQGLYAHVVSSWPFWHLKSMIWIMSNTEIGWPWDTVPGQSLSSLPVTRHPRLVSSQAEHLKVTGFGATFTSCRVWQVRAWNHQYWAGVVVSYSTGCAACYNHQLHTRDGGFSWCQPLHC